jgi:hypothetical protein
MNPIDRYILNISDVGIIVSLIFYENTLGYSYWYFCLEIIRTFLTLISNKISNPINIVLVLYYFSLFIFFLNEPSIIYSMWNGYVTIARMIYAIYNIFIYKKQTYDGPVIDKHHPLMKPYHRSSYPVVGRHKRNLNSNSIKINVRGISEFTS